MMKRRLVLLAMVGMLVFSSALWAAPGIKSKKAAQQAALQLENKLKARTISFQFVDQPLGEVLGFIQTLSGASIILDPAVDRGTPVSLNIQNMSVYDALGWISKVSGTKMVMKSTAVLITPDEKAESTGAHQKAARLALRARQGRVIGKLTVTVSGNTTAEMVVYEGDTAIDVRKRLAKLKMLHKALSKPVIMSGSDPSMKKRTRAIKLSKMKVATECTDEEGTVVGGRDKRGMISD